MKKIITVLLSSLLAACTVTSAAALEGPAYGAESLNAQSESENDLYHFYGMIEYSFVNTKRIAKHSIVGEVIGGGYTTDGNWYELACDGNIGTWWDGQGDLYEKWVGIVTTEPAVVKSFKLATQDADGDGVSDRRHAIWGGRVQGSDDGMDWEDLYVIEYTDFEDYANDTENNYLTIALPENEKAYTYFRYINNDDGAHALAEFQLFAEGEEEAPIVCPAYPAYDYIIFGDEYPELDVAFGEGYPGSTAAGIAECETGTLLKGLAATSVNSNGTFAYNGNITRYNPANAFDGNNLTFFYAFNQSSMYHPILILEQAYELTEIRLFTYPSAAVPTTGHLIQGSNDGENWVTIVALPTITTDSYVIFTPEAHNYEGYLDYSENWVGGGSYSMYRYINTCGTSYNGISDIEFYGVPAEPTVVTPDMVAHPDLSVDHYPGTMDVTDKVSVSTDGSLVGTVIGGGYGWNGHNYDHAFDGKKSTYYDPNFSSPYCWIGIMVENPTVLTEVKFYPVNNSSELGRLRRIEGGHIQGSNDGENWTTILAYTADDIPDPGEWVVKSCDSEEAFLYFRYVNNGLGHGEASEILFFGETDADVNFELADTNAKVGGTVEVEITVDSREEMNSVALYELTYDADVLTFVEFTGFGEILTDSFFGTDGVDNEKQTILFALGDKPAAISGVIASIKFTVNEEAKVGDVTAVSMKSLVKMDSQVIESAVSSAKISIISFLPGDIDKDDAVNILDVVALFRHAMLPEMYPIAYEGDVDFNKDGTVNILDVVALFRYAMLPEMYPLG